MVIGVTGGVGCGKSAVLKILNEKFGCYIIESDKAGHLVMQNGMKAYGQIVREFGEDILDSERKIDRAKLAGIVFADREKLEKLNRIVHPAVRKCIVNEIARMKEEDAGTVIVMGWVCLLAFPQIIHALSKAAFAWLLAGGLIYTAGGIIYALKVRRFNEKHWMFGTHEIFHLFVMGGSICHFIVMFQYVSVMPIA